MTQHDPQHHDQLYIGGRWTAPSSGSRITVTSPNTGEVIGSVPEALESDVDAAVSAARAAFDDPAGWSQAAPAERAAVLRRFADAVEARREAFAAAVSSQNGMPIAVSSQLEAVYPGALLRYYADLVEGQDDDVRAGLFGGTVRVRRKPVGVVGAIVPWNFPQTLAFFKIAPALAAGCTLVVKPSPETVLDSVPARRGGHRGRSFPPASLNIVPGGREIGAYLVAHPGSGQGRLHRLHRRGPPDRRDLRAPSAPGDPRTRRQVGRRSSSTTPNSTCATIGNDLFVATLLNNGQTCFLGTRVLAPRSRYARSSTCSPRSRAR